MKPPAGGGAVGPALLGAGLVAVSLAARGLVPIDETRYASVAWEMWSRGDWLVPHLNGAPYSHKPPLLFWLVCLGWRVFGVSEAWPRIVPALFSLASLFLTARIARRLWPEDAAASELAPWILAGTGIWAVFSSVLFFDPLVAFFTLLAWIGLLTAAEGRGRAGWLTFGLALGLGILSKGPVVFAFALPPALLAPWWGPARVRARAGAWTAGFLAALLLGVALALLWAIPAARAGGETYRNEILWGQTAERLVQSFAHRRPWWFYAAALPVVLLPWSLWGPVLRGLLRLRHGTRDPGVRFCMALVLPGLVVLSLVSGKQPQYLLPILPGFALLAARAASLARAPVRRGARALQVVAYAVTGALLLAASSGVGSSLLPTTARALPLWPGLVLVAGSIALLRSPALDTAREVRLLAAAMLAFLAILHAGAIRPVLLPQDLHEVAQRIRRAQDEQRPVAHTGRYHGQYQFLGRLSFPLEVIEPPDVVIWAREHSAGMIVAYEPRGWTSEPGSAPDLVRPYRGRTLVLWSSEAIAGRRGN